MNIHLLFVSNNNYIPHIAVTLASIFENNKNLRFEVHILTTDLTNEYKDRLKDFVQSYGNRLDIKVIRENELEINPQRCGQWGIYPSLKLYAADFFPNIDLMLYIDADMVCIRHLNSKGLLNIDMSEYYIAATADAQDGYIHKKRLGIPTENFYGNAGFMYLNLKKWREDNIREKCFEFFNNVANTEKIKFGEQDVINKICTGHILELPIEYNIMNQYYLHTDALIPDRYKCSINRHKQEAIIIHYIGSNKPWFEDRNFPLDEYYWKYQKLTPWKGAKYGYSSSHRRGLTNIRYKIGFLLHKYGIRKGDWYYDI